MEARSWYFLFLAFDASAMFIIASVTRQHHGLLVRIVLLLGHMLRANIDHFACSQTLTTPYVWRRTSWFSPQRQQQRVAMYLVNKANHPPPAFPIPDTPRTPPVHRCTGNSERARSSPRHLASTAGPYPTYTSDARHYVQILWSFLV